jgi:hypothetical protein
MSNIVEEELTLIFLKKVSEVYKKSMDDLTPVWETIKSGKKPVVTKVVQVCSHKLTSGKNKGQPCGKKLKDGVCAMHPPKPVEKKEPVAPQQEPEILEEEEEELPLIATEKKEEAKGDLCPVVLSAGSRKGEACGKKVKKGESKCAKHC